MKKTDLQLWFHVVSSNGFLLLFVIAIILTIFITPLMIDMASDPDSIPILYYIASAIGPVMAFLIVKNGFIKVWKDIKNKNIY
jgi:hypothetical protein